MWAALFENPNDISLKLIYADYVEDVEQKPLKAASIRHCCGFPGQFENSTEFIEYTSSIIHANDFGINIPTKISYSYTFKDGLPFQLTAPLVQFNPFLYRALENKPIEVLNLSYTHKFGLIWEYSVDYDEEYCRYDYENILTYYNLELKIPKLNCLREINLTEITQNLTHTINKIPTEFCLPHLILKFTLC